MTEEFKSCGRMTKAGTPCKNPQGHGWGVDGLPCRTHDTEEGKKLYRMLRTAWQNGYAQGKDSGRMEMKHELAREARDAEELARFRTHTSRGQLVVVKGYTYVWSGSVDLKVGDTVLLPAGWSSGPWEGVVEKVGSSYHGDMKEVKAKVKGVENG